MGGFAILVGIAWFAGAIRTRRDREDIARTYAAAGGPAYTAMQMGCAGAVIVIGLGIIVGMLIQGTLR